MEDSKNRALLFDGAAIAYHRFRPDYPETLVDEMLSFGGVGPSSHLLEVGCGTGKATVQVARRGYSIDCIDPGANLLEVARRNCEAWPLVRFHLGKFEQVTLKYNYYDLIYSAQAFHWVDRGLRWSLCRRYLVPRAAVAILHNYSPLAHQGPGKELNERLEQITGGAMQSYNHEEAIGKCTEEMKQAGIFSTVRIRRHNWFRSFSADQYVGLFTTFSYFLSMTNEMRQKVEATIREIIGENGGIYRHHYESVLFEGMLAQRQET